MKRTNSIFKGIISLIFVLIGLCFANCSDENGGGGSIVGNTYKNHDFYLDEDGWGWDNTTTITFKTSSSCEIKAWGYDYTDYDKERFSWTEICSYKVSGNTITIIDSPLYYYPVDQDFINHGSYIETSSGDIYYKQ
ncbi:MAG: hypothetical protein J6B83_09540 [Bacteroidaceae bacterium]|nr:hypothetical protein [Bacteroidaceae bacterium]